MRSRAALLAGSGLFLVVAPGTIAGYLPWALGGWRFEQDFGNAVAVRAAGGVLVALGGLALLECFVRFAWSGLGTPAPIAPPERLVVTGLYRHVRNPMYVAVFALVLGQALLFGQTRLLLYAAAVWTLFHTFVLAYEEPTLRERFPDDYARYRQAVPRWIRASRPGEGDDRRPGDARFAYW